jgi:hypothetical protein
MAELKPCPFCGGEANFLTENFGECVWVKCSVCGVQSSKYYKNAIVDGKNGEGCGKDWFLTREEAEAALAGEGGKDHG